MSEENRRYPKLAPEDKAAVLKDLKGYLEATERQREVNQFMQETSEETERSQTNSTSESSRKQRIMEIAKGMVESIEKRPPVH